MPRPQVLCHKWSDLNRLLQTLDESFPFLLQLSLLSCFQVLSYRNGYTSSVWASHSHWQESIEWFWTKILVHQLFLLDSSDLNQLFELVVHFLQNDLQCDDKHILLLHTLCLFNSSSLNSILGSNDRLLYPYSFLNSSDWFYHLSFESLITHK